MKDFSKKMKPMYDLLADKDDVKKKSGKKVGQKYNSKALVEWNEKHQEILDQMIEYLKSPQVMAYPNFDLPFFITTDASNEGLGSVLYQAQDGVDRVVSYASRTLSEAEKNYHMHSGKLEFLALKWAVTERFADYLRYSPIPFQIYTDNNPLTYVLTSAKLNAVGMRWVNDLADFNFSIKYRAGKLNGDADYLSRRSLEVDEMKQACTETYDPRELDAVIANCQMQEVEPVMVNSLSVKELILEGEKKETMVSSGELKEKQIKDEVISPVYQAVALGSRPERGEWSQLSHKSRVLLKNFGKLSIDEHGILVRETVRYRQVVLPKDFHQMVFVELHENMGHLGVEKVTELAQQRFYWPGMAQDVKDYIQKKCRCIVNKKPNQSEKAPLVPITATYPFEIVAIDYVKLVKCKGGFEYALVVTDHFTRFTQVYATRNKGSKAAADKIYNNFIMQYGFPTRIHSDRGGEFTSTLFQELHKLTNIKSSKTTPYHPQGNGLCERFNRTMINMLKSLSQEAKKDWKMYLPKLSFAYNSTIHKSTGYSPFKLLMGKESKLPIDFVLGIAKRGEKLQDKTYEQFVQEWTKSMEEACGLATLKMGKLAQYNKGKFDERAKAAELVVGDRVLMLNKKEKLGTGKLHSYFEETLFEVLEKRKDLPVFKIRNVDKESDVRLMHRNMLMECNDLLIDTFRDVEQDAGLEDAEHTTPKPSGKTGTVKKKPVIAEDIEDDDDFAVVIQEIEPAMDDQVVWGDEEVVYSPGPVDVVAEEEDPNDATVAYEEGSVGTAADVEGEDPADATLAYAFDIPANGSIDETGIDEEDVVDEDWLDESDRVTDSPDGNPGSDVDSDASPPVRRSGRTRNPASIFTYDEVGGQPSHR